MLRPAAVLLTITLACTLTGCFNTKPTEPAPERTEANLPTECLTPTDGAINKLWADIEATTPDATLEGVGVAASDESEMTFIAIRFNDGNTHTGTWGTLQDPTTETDIAFVAVDEVAEVSATYLQPKDLDKVGVLLPGAILAVDCIQ